MEIPITAAERAHLQALELASMQLRCLEADQNDELQKLTDKIKVTRRERALMQRALETAAATLALVHDCGANWELKQDRSAFVKGDS